MNETSVAQVLVGDPLEVAFPRHYAAKEFTTDALKLRNLLRKRENERLTEAELGEVRELRKHLKRIDGDVAMLLVIERRLKGGLLFF